MRTGRAHRIHKASLRVVLASTVVLSGALGLTGARAATTRQADTGPTISFTSPAGPGSVKGVLAVSGTAQAAAGIARVDLRLDERPYVPVTGTSSWALSIDTAAFEDGPHNLKARITDAAGAQAWADLAIVIQNSAPGSTTPRVAIATPAAGTKLQKDATVKGTAAAPLGVARVDLRIDDGPYQRASGLGAWSAKVDTRVTDDGTHTLTARVTDAAGAQVVSRRSIVVANHTGQIYWGALVSGHLYGYGNPPWDMRSLRAFEQHAGKGVSILALGSNWGAPHPNFPTAAMTAIRKHGSIPLYSWGSMAPGGAEQPRFSLSNIINGKFDGYIRRFALAAKAWGNPFFLRLDWEMNLQNWYPWIETVNGNKRGQFVKMWRHVHDIFTQVGAQNVTWVWCPNAEYDRSIKPLGSLYPGNAYVDWTCVDGYNWGENPWRRNIWQTFSEVIGPTYKNIVANVAPSKPVMIGETASSEYGGSKAGWIKDVLSVQLPRVYRRIQAFIWFNVHDKADWQIETSAKASAAFRAGIRSSYYAGADFGSLRVTKLRPLSPVSLARR